MCIETTGQFLDNHSPGYQYTNTNSKSIQVPQVCDYAVKGVWNRLFCIFCLLDLINLITLFWPKYNVTHFLLVHCSDLKFHCIIPKALAAIPSYDFN